MMQVAGAPAPSGLADSLQAAEETDADCICLDLEDAVAHSQKAASRDIVTQALASELVRQRWRWQCTCC